MDGIADPQTMRGLVRVLQTELNKQFGPGLVVDGIFGGKMESAVRAFQRDNGITVDGVVGNQLILHY